jgi:hypothetical protein
LRYSIDLIKTEIERSVSIILVILDIHLFRHISLLWQETELE